MGSSGPDPAPSPRGVTAFLLLSGALGAFSFWSTALAEITGALLLLSAALVLRPSTLARVTLPLLPRLGLLFWALYVAAVLASIVSAGSLSLARAGLLWHPLLFPAALLVPPARRTLRKAAMLFLAGGVSSAVLTVTIDAFRDRSAPIFAFTGLTTFADLLVLAAIVALSFFLPMVRPGRPVWGFAVPCILIAFVVIWSAERLPVLALAVLGGVRIASAGTRALALWVLCVGAPLFLGSTNLSDKTGWLIRGNHLDRYVVWEEGLKQIPGAPIFGYGPGSYPRVLPDEARKRFINLPPSSWHNDMIETWLDSGPIAAAALGALVFLGVVAWMRGAWRGVREWFYRPGGVEGLLFICLVAFGLAGSVVTTSVLGLAFWFLLGLTLNPLTAIVRSS